MCTQDNEAGIQQVRPCPSTLCIDLRCTYLPAVVLSTAYACLRFFCSPSIYFLQQEPSHRPALAGGSFRYMQPRAAELRWRKHNQTIYAAAVRQGLALGTTLHFEFYQEAAPQDAGLRVVHLPRMDAYPESEHEIMHQLVQSFAVPEKLRCDLLARPCLLGLHGSTCMLYPGMQWRGIGT